MEVYCDATCTQWSPDGKQLALWPRSRDFAGEGYGLEPFLPPVGQEDAALSDAEVIERYFQPTLALGLQDLPTYHYPYFLVQYARALAHMGKVGAAEMRYREALEFVRHSSQWDATPVVNAYAAFLRQHGRAQEAAALLASVPTIQLSPRLPGECGLAFAYEERTGARTPEGSEQTHVGMPPVPQPFAPLYIVAVPEKRK